MIMKSRLRITGFIALVLAGLSWLAETVFYGTIDSSGILQESFFLPLTYILAALGIVLIFASLVIKLRQ